jgi:hypothetical protein
MRLFHAAAGARHCSPWRASGSLDGGNQLFCNMQRLIYKLCLRMALLDSQHVPGPTAASDRAAPAQEDA